MKRNFSHKRAVSTTVIAIVVIVVIVIAAAGAYALTIKPSSSTTTTSTNTPVTLTVWDTYTPGSGEQVAFNKTISTFSAAYPWITLNIQTQPFSSAESDYITAAIANQAPDVLRAANDWTGTLVAQGFLQSLQPYVNSKLLANYTTGSNGAYSVNGQLYGLGENTNGLALLYNKALFSTAGLSGPPTTTNGSTNSIVSDAKALASMKFNSTSNVIPIAFPQNNGYWFWPWLFGYGGTIFTSGVPPNPTINSTAAVSAVQFLNALVNQGYMPPQLASSSDMTAAFCAGQVAMILDGPWDISTYQACSGLSWAAAPMPNVTSTGLSLAPTWGYQGWVISSGLPLNVQQAAFDFITFVTSYSAQQNLFKYALDLPDNVALATSSLITGNSTVSGFAAQGLLAANAYGYNSAAMNNVWTPVGNALAAAEPTSQSQIVTAATIQSQLNTAETAIITANGG
jgi:arabinogalactan oligomer / maltooligosaccharide transport system substrate-binding protein